MIARVAAALLLFSTAVGAQFRDIPSPDSAAVFDGVYFSTYNESIFSPCDVPGIGSGWWMRFARDRDGAFLLQHQGRPGAGTLAHFIRVRGRVSKPGHYGLGFQTREIVVDSVLDIQETVQPCASFEELPQPWSPISATTTIVGAAMTDDNTLIAIHDLEATIKVWNLRSGQMVSQFRSDDNGELNWGSTVPMTFTHDGKRLAVGGRDGVVRVWDVPSGRRVWTFQPSDSLDATVNGQKLPTASSGLAFNQSGTLLANMMIAGNTSIWSMATGKRVGNHHGGYTGGRVLFLGDSALLVSADSGKMKILPMLGAAPIWNVGTPLTNFNVMDRSPDGRWLVLKSWGDTIYLWSLDEGRIAHTLVVPNWFMGSVAFSPDGKMIAAPGGANALYVWDLKTGQPLLSFQKYRMGIEKVWFTPDSRALVSYSMADSVFKIVHLDPKTTDPIQPGWGAQSWPNPPPGVTLGSISGFVRDTANNPIIGVQITVFDGEHPDSPAIGRAETNAAGHFLLQKLRVRHITLRASKPGYSTDVEYTHMSGIDAGVDFVLKADSGR